MWPIVLLLVFGCFVEVISESDRFVPIVKSFTDTTGSKGCTKPECQYNIKKIDGDFGSLFTNPTTAPVDREIHPTCPLPITFNPFCHEAVYRSIDGTCNNLFLTKAGASFQPFSRFLPPQTDHSQKPNSRTVSQKIFSTDTTNPDNVSTPMLTHFGQFLSHDLTLAMEILDDEDVCENAPADKCFTIDIPVEDTKLPKGSVFTLEQANACMRNGVKRQINNVTSYLDGSQIYGPTDEIAKSLRSFTGGQLKEHQSKQSEKGLGFLPECDNGESTCVLAGDIRAGEQMLLSTLHTLFLREHNRFAKELQTLNPKWNDATIYQETRKIVIAVLQHITYDHWLPKILGKGATKTLEEYRGVYRADRDPSMQNSVATAALRFGHAFVVSDLKRFDSDLKDLKNDVKLLDAFLKPERILEKGFMDELLYGAVAANGKVNDPSVNSDLTDNLFPREGHLNLDLAAINIRDYYARSNKIYPAFLWSVSHPFKALFHARSAFCNNRRICGLEIVNTWDQFGSLIMERENLLENIQALYADTEQLDLWVAGLLEKPVEGGKLGPTFSCLLLTQFFLIRIGDRFWYERESQFTQEQLESINDYSLAKILCNNLDHSHKMPMDAFVLGNVQNCTDLADIKLDLWKNEH